MSVFKPNPMLNGKRYSVETDDQLNVYQRQHIAGDFSVTQPIPQEDGEPLPPLKFQWEQDWKRRVRNEQRLSSS